MLCIRRSCAWPIAARLALVVAVAGACGCKTRPGTASADATPSAGTAASGPAHEVDAGWTADQKLALAPVHGTTAADQRVFDMELSVEKMPPHVDGWILLGHAWVRKARGSNDPGFYLNADAAARVALALAPDYSPALNLQSLVLLNSHKFEQARTLAQRVVDDHPHDPMGYGSLSDALLELGRYPEAEKAAETMVDVKPGLPSYSRISFFAWLHGDDAQALRVARLAIDAADDPRDPEPRDWELVQTAMIFWHRGDYVGAEAGFDLALQGAGDYAPALVGKARCALARGDGKRAGELLDRAYALSPLPETAWLLGDARGMAGDDDGAAKAYALVEKDGRVSDPRTLSLFYSTTSVHADQALALAEEERKVRGDIYTDDAYAWALHRSGRETDAKAAMLRVLSLGTKDARLLYHAGAIRIAAGEAAAGRKLVADAVRLNPKFDVTGAAEAQALLGDAGR
jgi:tetratricopeptide (TPR) repeat protein